MPGTADSLRLRLRLRLWLWLWLWREAADGAFVQLDARVSHRSWCNWCGAIAGSGESLLPPVACVPRVR